jgi:hypothetical protein
LSTQPNPGVVVLNPDGSFTFTPLLGFVNEDTFTYFVNGAAEEATVTVAAQRVDLAVDSNNDGVIDAKFEGSDDLNEATMAAKSRSTRMTTTKTNNRTKMTTIRLLRRASSLKTI